MSRVEISRKTRDIFRSREAANPAKIGAKTERIRSSDAAPGFHNPCSASSPIKKQRSESEEAERRSPAAMASKDKGKEKAGAKDNNIEAWQAGEWKHATAEDIAVLPNRNAVTEHGEGALQLDKLQTTRRLERSSSRLLRHSLLRRRRVT